MSAVASVVVRMYRNLLGDCFLLRVQEEGGVERRILIDCGILQGLGAAADGSRASGKDRIRAVAADIVETCRTGGAKPEGCDAYVDLLVCTHQHFDHLGGFIQANDILLGDARLRYGRLWLAWTENRDDAVAGPLYKRMADRKAALGKLVKDIAPQPGNAPPAQALDDGRTFAPLLDELRTYIGFFGPLEGAGDPALDGQPRLTMDVVLDAIKAKVGPDRTDYLVPGQVVQTPGDASLTVAVLGPPRDLTFLKRDLPSADGQETYLDEQSLAQWLLPAADQTAAPDATIARSSPFAKRFWTGTTMAAVAAAGGDDPAAARAATPAARWLAERYYGNSLKAPPRPDPLYQSFRRIDGAWTEAAAALALDLDSDTNNTSLVLAFRLPDDTFLLFAADAQVGNWQSWHEQTYAISGATLSATDILNRTRLYKVGHHGSHNATLRGKGLELMTHGDLVAMCSTVEEEASTKKGWEMPYGKLKEQLLAHTDGRLLRGDRLWDADPDTADHRAANPAFAGRLRYGPPGREGLYVELEMYGRMGAPADAPGGGTAANS